MQPLHDVSTYNKHIVAAKTSNSSFWVLQLGVHVHTPVNFLKQLLIHQKLVFINFEAAIPLN